MKTNASSTASAWGIKRCICPCEVGTKITYGGSNLQLSMYKLHRRLVIGFFLFYGNEIHTCFTVKDHIEDKIFKILYIISHNICNNIGPLLCQPLRFIRTIKSNKTNSTNLYPPTKGYLRETCKSQNINPIYLSLSSPSVSFRS